MRGTKKVLSSISKKVVAYTCALSMLCGAFYFADNVEAAKKPKLSKKTLSIEVGKTKKITVKNSAKKAKVTWKSTKKSVAKIGKKASGKKAYATIKAVKEGKATIKATYKLGKKKTTLTCKVTVTPKNDVTPTVAPTAAPTAVPTVAPTVAPTAAPTATPTPGPDVWVATWGTAEEKNDISADAMPKIPLENSTVRQIIRVTTSGKKMKIKLSNQYGKTDVEVKSLHVAKQVVGDTFQTSAIDTDTDTVVTVDGYEDFTIPAGEVIETDPFDFDVTALDNIAITTYFGSTPTNNITGHRGARATTYQVEGNQVSAASFDNPNTTKSWFFLADVSLLQPEGSKAVVCFGDSITDGYGTDADYLGKKPDSYTRWGDYFAKRLQANEATKNVSVINEGIGSNSMMGSYPTDAGKDRFERDLLAHDGVGYCIVLFGVNDLDKLPNTSKFEQLKPEYEKMVKIAHENGIKIYAAPILPFGTSSYYNENSEAVRKMINDWMRSEESGFDGIIDFESALADPADPKNILEKYTHTDGLHPYDGYDVMAEAIDLKMFE